MQNLSAYSLEVPGLLPPESGQLFRQITDAVDVWLSEKGVEDEGAASGIFHSRTVDVEGTFRQSNLRNEEGELREVVLEEATRGGQTFRTTLYIINTPFRVLVYATLGARNAHNVVRPGGTDVRCPRIVRSILALRSDWKLGDTVLRGDAPLGLHSAADGIALASRINSTRRSIPIVAVSIREGGEVWEHLSRNLAYDLTGLAETVQLSEETSWSLTEEIGKRLSCYMGAVRVYWPVHRRAGEAFVPGTVWTAEHLLSFDEDGEGQSRFRAQLRRSVMGAAALGIEPPFEVNDIRTFAARRRLSDLEAHGNKANEELTLAREFFDDNEILRAQVEALTQALGQSKGGSAVTDMAPAYEETGENATVEQEMPPIQRGDVRFYKKMHSPASHDILVRVNECRHNNWQSGHSGVKAQKGVAKLEQRDDWSTFQHCASCKGGGMWRVRW